MTVSEPGGSAVLSMTMSLDGFVNDREGSGGRLYPDLAGLADSDDFRRFLARTGAVVMGRRTYDMGIGDYTGYEFQLPIFVVTSRPPETPAKDVAVIGGADVVRQRLVDEVQIAIAPVLLGGGLRLFDELGDEPATLTLIEVIESPIGTEITYRLGG